jgi:hypothetical protein
MVWLFPGPKGVQGHSPAYCAPRGHDLSAYLATAQSRYQFERVGSRSQLAP